MVFLLGGLAGLAFGILVDGQAIADFIARHVSPDGGLSPQTAGQVGGFRWVILGAGVVSIAAALITGRLTIGVLGRRLPLRERILHYHELGTVEPKLELLLRRFRFVPVRELLGL